MPEYTITLDQLPNFAESISNRLTSGQVLALQGELGAGKTTFTKALIQALGGDKHKVSSPTFTIRQAYPIADHSLVVHFDLYRLRDESELENIGFIEELSDPEVIKMIEWPELARSLLPDTTLWIQFEIIDELTRKITINP